MTTTDATRPTGSQPRLQDDHGATDAAGPDRATTLLATMTLDEKAAQLVGYWLDQDGVVAPMQGEMAAAADGRTLADITRDGIGQFTRVYGTRPVEPDDRAAWLWAEQRRLKRETRLGIPALVHEECLTGLAAWKAATFPTPLAWGAAFDPDLVERVGAAIGASMRQLGVHQGLAPVLDVVRDPRWGRVDECIGEDPYLVGTVGTAYVRGLQSAGVDATLKHFLGYSASQAGRNHAPVHAGPREVADVYLPPFVMALRDGGARSVMNSYAEIDGVPVAANGELLTGLLRDELGFDGTVVADYFSVAFLEVMHGIAADRGEAAALALEAGIDVELPTGDAYLAPLVERVRSGLLDEALVDRAVLRVLRQKERLGLLDPQAFEDEPPTGIDLDTPLHRSLARQLAARSLVLLSNDARGTAAPVLPLRAGASVAVIGPNADRAEALQGCYSFANHVLASHPDLPLGFAIPTVREAMVDALGEDAVRFAAGCAVTGSDRAGFDDAVAVAAASDVAVVVVGDQAGLFGRGTVGEGNDTESLDLPGVQRELVEAVVATGTPTVMVLLTGRPYAIGWALDGDGDGVAGAGHGAGGSLPSRRRRAGLLPRRGGRHRHRRPAHRRRLAVRPPARLAPAGRRCAAVHVPAPAARRPVRRHRRRLDPGPSVRLRPRLHVVRVRRPGRRRVRPFRRRVRGVRGRPQHRFPRRRGRRPALRPRRARQRHPTRGPAARLRARRARRGGVHAGPLPGARPAVRVHRPADAQGRRTRGRAGLGRVPRGGVTTGRPGASRRDRRVR